MFLACVAPVETVPACEVDAGAPVWVLVVVVAGVLVWAVVAVLAGAPVCVLLTGTLGGGGSGGDWLFEEKKLFTATAALITPTVTVTAALSVLCSADEI